MHRFIEISFRHIGRECAAVIDDAKIEGLQRFQPVTELQHVHRAEAEAAVSIEEDDDSIIDN